jgi:ABC-2 type transport system permease protein
MPFFWLLFIGTGFSSSIQLPGMNYSDYLAPGIVGMIILFSSIFAGVSVIWDRQFGFLKEILVAPVLRISIVLGKTIGASTIALINGVTMLLISILMGLVRIDINILISPLFMLLIAVCFVSIGLIIASRMRSMEGFQTIMSFVVMPIFFLSGALFPLNNVPVWMKIASYADPLTYGIDGMRLSLVGIGMFDIWFDLGILTIWSLSMLIFGGYIFARSTID